MGRMSTPTTNRIQSEPNLQSVGPEALDTSDPDPTTETEIGSPDHPYRAVFEASSAGLIITDTETGVVLEANPAACSMHGYKDMAGLRPTAFIHPDGHPLFTRCLDQHQMGSAFRYRTQHVRCDGTIFDVEASSRGLVYRGKPMVLTVVHDVSQDVQTLELLEKRAAERTLEIERRREVAEGLRGLLAIVNSRRSLDEVFAYIVAQTRQLLGCDACAIFLPAETNDATTLSIHASSGLEPDHAIVTLPVNESSTGLAYLRLRPVAVSNLQEVLPGRSSVTPSIEFRERSTYIEIERLPSILDKEEGQIRTPLRSFAVAFGALLAVPLAVEDHRYGVISLYYHQPHEFDDDQVALATAFADQTALAIENARLREQAEQAAVIEDRQRLARELHDAVTQTLFSASLIAEVLPDLWEADPEEARDRLSQLRRLARGALAEMRILLVELRPQVLADLALHDLLRQLADAASGSGDVDIAMRVAGPSATRLPPLVRVALYRIAQETFNNVVKHAGVTRVHCTLTYHQDGGVELDIIDDGCGFDPGLDRPGHLGLGIMRERAREIGASLDIDSYPGQGVRVLVSWRNLERSPS